MEKDIQILEKLEKVFTELRKDDEEGHSSAYELQWEDIEAIENLINRVKELENADLTVVYMDGFYDGKKKIENKIKEKIEEVKDSKENYTFEKLTSEDIRRTIITNLQDLLK